MFHVLNTKELFPTNSRRTTLISSADIRNNLIPLFTPRFQSSLFEIGANALKWICTSVELKTGGILGIRLNLFLYRCVCSSFHSSRPLAPREHNRSIPPTNQHRFQAAVSRLSARFTPEELFITLQNQVDPMVCLELFNYASQQQRFQHNDSTYHITIKKLGVAKMYTEMDEVVNLLLTSGHTRSVDLYNTIMYFYTNAGKLSKAVTVFKHMKNSEILDNRPSLRSYNILLSAFVRKNSNLYVNRMYMETTRSLFRQMIHDNIEPDSFSLNCVIRSYVMGLFVNDALRIFHQMGVVYSATPNSYSYDYLLHGLCAQGRTVNAMEWYAEMKRNGYVPSRKSWNSYANALALEGEIKEAVCILGEMSSVGETIDNITYRTVVDQMCRRRTYEDAKKFLKGLRKYDVVNDQVYRRLLCVIKGM